METRSGIGGRETGMPQGNVLCCRRWWAKRDKGEHQNEANILDEVLQGSQDKASGPPACTVYNVRTVPRLGLKPASQLEPLRANQVSICM